MDHGGSLVVEDFKKSEGKKMKKRNGVVLAAAVAGLFLAGQAMAQGSAAPAAPAKATVKCKGINSCKGKGACKSAGNACAGKNGCGGKGWMNVGNEKECLDKKGTVVK